MLRTPNYRNSLQNLNFELHSGDMMALLDSTTSEFAGIGCNNKNTLLRLLSQSRTPRGKSRGIVELNGHKLSLKELSYRCAFLPEEDGSSSSARFSVQEYLSVYSQLLSPATNAFSLHDRVSSVFLL